MKPVFQTRTGREGNCWPAALASLFEVPLEEVDHCACSFESMEWADRTQAWLAKRGLFYVEIPWKRDMQNLPITAPPDGALVIVGCNTDRALPHVVIGRVRMVDQLMHVDVVHDPHPRGSTGLRPDALFLFCALHG